jgi:hypothetical protein
MSIGMEDDEDGISYAVFDFTGEDRPKGIKPGFYYTIDLDEDDDTEEDKTMSVRGPYRSADDASKAAAAFIEDAITGDTDEDELDVDDEEVEFDEDEDEFLSGRDPGDENDTDLEDAA